MKAYVARQPIFDNNRDLYAYELLYRNSENNVYDPDVDGSKATRALIYDMVNVFRFHSLTHGKYAFINFTQELLVQRMPLVLNPKEVILEVLETATPNDELIECIKELRQKRYIFALDDYVGTEKFDPIIDYMDIVKLDFQLLTPSERVQVAKRVQKLAPGARMLAEKVETPEDYKQAIEIGCTLYQGYYFDQPAMISKNTLEMTNTTCMRLLRELSRPNPNYQKLAEIAKLDIGLSYLLLHRINTLEYYRSNRITNIKDALVRMGFRELWRWLILYLVRGVTQEAMDERVRIALVRGVFAEKIANALGKSAVSEDAFTAGMFSMIDVMLETEIFEVLEDLSVSDQVREALLGGNNILHSILEFIKTYENGGWEEAREIFGGRLDMKVAATLYVEAVDYADLAFGDPGDGVPGSYTIPNWETFYNGGKKDLFRF